MSFFGKIRRTTLLLLGVAILVPTLAYAESPYQGYIYNNLDESPESINGYLYEDSIDGMSLGMEALKSPEDLFVATDDTLYIVDSGNNRVLHISKEKKLLGTFGDKEGNGKLNTPKGVYVDTDGNVYVADTMNRRIAIYDNTGKYVKEYLQPSSPLLGENFVYSPSKLLVDKRGYLFVVSDGATQGMLQIRPDGKFSGFFGANHVNFSMTRVIVKLIASKEQKAQIASVKPPEFSNLFQDSEGFIYTTSLGIRVNQVKRLSAVGVDTLNGSGTNRYGDYYMRSKGDSVTWDAFVDVTISKTGLITALDQTTGRMFQYDKLGNLLFIWGGIGTQDGLFVNPSSIAQTSDGTIFVADRMRNRIDRFRSTPFADIVHKASELYVEGKYQQSSEPWHQVLDMNSNYDLAYYSIGKALYRQHEYKQSMTYFKKAERHGAYSDALHEYRKVYIRDHFGTIMTSVLGSLATLWLLKKISRTGLFRRWKQNLMSRSKRYGKGGGMSGNA